MTTDVNIEQLLDAERGRGGFSAQEKSAMWRGIEQSVGALAAGATAATAAETIASSSTKLAKWKLGALLSAVAVGGAGAGAAAHAHWGEPKIVYVEHAAPPVVVETAPPPSTPEATAAPAASPASSRAPTQPVARRDAPTTIPSTAPAKDPALARERTLLDMARTALSRGDASGALASLDSHAREFPSSQLAEEREVLAIQALASANRTNEARQRAASFRARFPKSPLLAIVDEATQ